MIQGYGGDKDVDNRPDGSFYQDQATSENGIFDKPDGEPYNPHEQVAAPLAGFAGCQRFQEQVEQLGNAIDKNVEINGIYQTERRNEDIQQ